MSGDYDCLQYQDPSMSVAVIVAVVGERVCGCGPACCRCSNAIEVGCAIDMGVWVSLLL